MKQYFGLLENISKEFHIQKGEEETINAWKARIVYSYLGQIGLSSLFDIQEDLSASSIQHFKSRISEALESFLEMYPELTGAFSTDDESLLDEIYDIIQKTGLIYHEPYRIVPCVRKLAIGSNMIFSRGQAIEEKRFLSGLGSYLPFINEKAGVSVSEMFMLHTENLGKSWLNLISDSVFTEVHAILPFEYLRTKPPFNRGYWCDDPDGSGSVSVARTGMPGKRIYYLYQYEGSVLRVSQLPGWRTDDYEYRSVATGNLMAQNTLPETVFRMDGNLVTMKIGYLFPPAEMNAIKLYSWPASYVGLPHDFTRIMNRDVFEEFHLLLSGLGFHFKEE